MAFCSNCGTQLEDDAKFCEKCGTPVDNEENQNNSRPQVKVQNNVNVKISPKLVGILAAVVVVVLIVMVIAKSYKPTLSLNDFVEVTFSGYETVGSAYVYFDEDAFIEKYEDKIKINSKSDLAKEMKTYQALYSDYSAAEMLVDDYISCYLDNNSNLSNGDTVTVRWDVDDETILDIFGVKLKYDETEYTVSSLEEAKVLDPFTDVEVTYSGLAPSGQANISNNSSDSILRYLNYYVDGDNYNLKNGDVITVKVGSGYSSFSSTDYIDQGVILSPLEKEYTVEGLSEYVSALDSLTDEIIESMKKQGEDVEMAYAANNWDDRFTLSSLDYLGSYLLTAKNSDNWGNQNKIILVYKVNVSANSLDDDKNDVHESFSFYWPIQYTDLVKLTDGTVSVDLSNYEYATQSFNKEFKFGSWSNSYSFRGYESLDTLFNKWVTAYLDSYNYESNVVQ